MRGVVAGWVIRGRVPWITLAVLALTAGVTILGLIRPGVLNALARRGGELSDSPWRLLTSLLVHDGGPAQIVVNLLGIAVVGAAAEWRFGPVRWLLLYLGGGLTGQFAGLLWQPEGAGASVALCGLIGGLLAVLLARRGALPPLAVLYSLGLIAALVGALRGPIVAALFASLAGMGASIVLRGPARQRLTPALAAAGLLGGVILTAGRDIHGPPLLLGACLGGLLLLREPGPVSWDSRRAAGRVPDKEERDAGDGAAGNHADG
jgi:rhomboid protease GluP